MYKLWLLALAFFTVFFKDIEAIKDTVEEGDCIIPKLANLTRKTLLDAMPEGGFYIPFKTKFEAYQLAELFLNKSLTAEDDISNFCPRLIWQPTIGDSQGTWFGFGRNASMICSSHDDMFEYQNCTITYNTSGNKVVETNVYFTLSDNKSFWLFVLCHDHDADGSDTKKSWTVISTEKNVDDEHVVQILEHVHFLGFDAGNSYHIDYDDEACKNIVL